MTKSINNRAEQAPDERAIGSILDGIRAVVRSLRVNTRAIEGQLGVSLAQLWVLQILNERAPQSLNELAEATMTHQSSVSVVVGRLVDAALATRTIDPADRRQRRVAITDAGKALLTKAPPTFQVNLIKGLRRLSPEERVELAGLMHRWLVSSGVDLSSAPPMMGEDEAGPRPESRTA